MSPPTPEQEDSALAALTGTITERKPVTDLDRDMMRLRMVAEAKGQGIPWTAIGAALGCSGTEAHRKMKRLAAQTQRTMLLEKAQQDGIAHGKTGKG